MEQAPFVMNAPTAAGRHLLCNVSTGCFARVSPQVFAAWEACAPGEAAPATQSSSTIQPDTASRLDAIALLQETGFLVEDADRLRRLYYQAFQAQRGQTDMLSLSIAPTYACNCRCPYCYEADKAAPWSFMSEEVERGLYAFVEERYSVMRFSALDVQWYGGDPQLCLDQVERISRHLWDFCQERQIAYTSMMLTNATRIGEAEAARVAAAHIQAALITLDGPEEQHNYRRPTVEAGNPYKKVLGAIEYLQGEGVRCDVVCNSDKINLPLLPRLQQDLDALGVVVQPVKLNDYAGTYGACSFCSPAFDLFTHEEFHRAFHDQMKSQGQLTKDSLQTLLRPCLNFCKGQTNHYYIIDNVGDVYKCDGRMGNKDYRLFNLLTDEPVLDAITFNPCEDAQCATCNLLPLCWGNCDWERQSCGMPCHPLHTMGHAYLNDLAECFPVSGEEFQVLLPGRNVQI